jgi:hypothetical protein
VPAWTAVLDSFGANYWPSHAGPGMWRDFRPAEIEADLLALRDAGVGTLRAFLLWPDFMPSPDRVEPDMLDRLASFVALVERSGLRLQLAMLVGHMSGQNWSPPWLDDPSAAYEREDLLVAQELLVRAAVERVRSSPAVEAYALTSEYPHFTGGVASGAVERWAARLYGAAKELDPDRAVTLGDGAWYVLGQSNGFAPTHPQDALGPHLYLADTDADRLVAGYGLAVATAGALAGERPVWLEEFGAPHTVFGEEEVAAWAGRVAFEARLQGATRVCWWCATDIELPGTDPYRHHGFEMRFGLLRADRSPRPVAMALREALERPLPSLPEAGLLVPSWLLGTWAHPFTDRPVDLGLRALRTSYAALRALGYRPRVVLEEDLASGRAGAIDLLVAPAVQKLLAPTWEALERFGGRLLFSYLHGTQFAQGSWTHRAREFYGGVPHNRFGLPEPSPSRLTVGDGDLDLPKAWEPFVGTPLLLEPVQAEVVARDDRDRPMWVRVGRRDLLLYPVEAVAESPAQVEPIYRAMLEPPGTGNTSA